MAKVRIYSSKLVQSATKPMHDRTSLLAAQWKVLHNIYLLQLFFAAAHFFCVVEMYKKRETCCKERKLVLKAHKKFCAFKSSKSWRKVPQWPLIFGDDAVTIKALLQYFGRRPGLIASRKLLEAFSLYMCFTNPTS